MSRPSPVEVGAGAAICVRLAEEGHHVVVADIDEASSQNVAAAIVADGLVADPMTADVRSEGEVAAMIDAVVERHDRLDVLVCQRGGRERGVRRRLLRRRVGSEVLDVNLKGPLSNTRTK